MSTSDAGIGTLVSGGLNAVVTRPMVLVYALLGTLFGVVPLVGWALQTILYGLAAGTAVRALGEEWTGARSLPRRLVSLLGATLVAAIGILVGLVFLILPGIYVLLRTALVPVEAVAGNEPALDAVTASWRRTEGHTLTLLGWYLLASVVGFAVLFVLSLVSLAGNPSLSTSPSFGFRILSALVVAPVFAVHLGVLAAMYEHFER